MNEFDELIAEGDEFIEEMHQHLEKGLPLKSHVQEVTQWFQRSREAIAAIDSDLAGKAPSFDSIRSTDENYLAFRSMRTLLRKVSRAKPQSPAPADGGGDAIKTTTTRSLKQIFVVHGHDDAMKLDVARFLERLELEPVILHEQVDQGRTVIEKFEQTAAAVGFAVVLMSPDDVGASKRSRKTQRFRARQNVIIELGYFLGALGRSRVCVLVLGDVEIPSDYLGVIYKKYDSNGGWKVELSKELERAGYLVNLRKAFS